MNTPEMKRYKSSEWNFALDIPKRWNAFPPVSTNSPAEVIRFASREDGTHLVIIFRSPHDPQQSLREVSDQVQQTLASKGFGNFATAETTIGSRAVLMLDFDKPKVEGSMGFGTAANILSPTERSDTRWGLARPTKRGCSTCTTEWPRALRSCQSVEPWA